MGSLTIPGREWVVFRRHKTLLSEMQWGELLCFSLLMESQAGQRGDYPQWHLAIHLVESVGDGPLADIHCINPLLLKAVRPELFAQLPLRDEFTKIAPGSYCWAPNGYQGGCGDEYEGEYEDEQ